MQAGRNRIAMLIAGLVIATATLVARAEDAAQTPREQMQQEAEALAPMVTSELAKELLAAVSDLPALTEPRVVRYNKETRDAMTRDEAAQRSEAELEGYEETEIDERFFYFTRYGTPLASVRAFDLIGRAGLEHSDGMRVLDFGFGSIGQLRLLASIGCDVVGVEVDPLLQAIYSAEGDTGAIARARSAGDGANGSLRLCFGQWPADSKMQTDVGGGFDVFVSKNTLKRGYIHPEQEVNPRMLVHLGVDDEGYVSALYDALAPGGYAMIYNLHPKKTPPGDGYIPWSDGRSPFTRDLLEKAGFKVLAFDADDTPFARKMAEALGWGEMMDLENDLFATYTLLAK